MVVVGVVVISSNESSAIAALAVEHMKMIVLVLVAYARSSIVCIDSCITSSLILSCYHTFTGQGSTTAAPTCGRGTARAA